MKQPYQKYIKTILLDEFDKTVKSQGIEAFFTPDEILKYGKEKLKSLAARYLVKKILIDHSNDEISYHDIEIFNKENGKPIISFKKHYSEKHVHISISHTRVRATVLVILEDLKSNDKKQITGY